MKRKESSAASDLYNRQLFPLREYLDQGGHIAIGSDGNTCTNPMEELRWLEYGQRLVTRTRNVSSDNTELHTGTNLYGRCLDGGGRAIGQKTGALKLGCRADLIVLDDNSADLANIATDSILDVLIFGTSQSLIKDVMVNGIWKITHYHHADEERIKNMFISATKAMRG